MFVNPCVRALITRNIIYEAAVYKNLQNGFGFWGKSCHIFVSGCEDEKLQNIFQNIVLAPPTIPNISSASVKWLTPHFEYCIHFKFPVNELQLCYNANTITATLKYHCIHEVIQYKVKKFLFYPATVSRKIML